MYVTLTYSVLFICYYIVNLFLVIDKECIEKQREIEKQQKITITLTLQIEELKQSLKGNYYNMYM